MGNRGRALDNNVIVDLEVDNNPNLELEFGISINPGPPMDGQDYNKLRNKPTLNGIQIGGDKVSVDYGLPNPVEKTEGMIQSVGMDENGKLFTEPASVFPSGGHIGDIISMTDTNIIGWITPASDLEGDNTRPITAAAVQNTVGNINALLATI